MQNHEATQSKLEVGVNDKHINRNINTHDPSQNRTQPYISISKLPVTDVPVTVWLAVVLVVLVKVLVVAVTLMVLLLDIV